MSSSNEHISLREFIERILDERQRALDLASTELNRRLEGMNELRQQLDRQAGTFVTREYVDATIQRIDSRISALQEYRANMEGRVWAIGAGFAIVNLAIAAFSAWHVLQK